MYKEPRIRSNLSRKESDVSKENHHLLGTQKRLTIEMVKRVTVLINLFNRKLGVHSVISPRKIMFGKKFRTPLCNISKLVMACDVTVNNKIVHLRAFYALYIGQSNSSTNYIVLKLSIKKVVTTSKYKPKPMAEEIITIVDEIGREEGMLDRIKFQHMHHELTFSDLYMSIKF